MQSVSEAMPTLMEQIKYTLQILSDNKQPDEPVEIPESTLEAFQNLAPLVPEDTRGKFEEIVAPSKGKESKLLTIENLKWLIGIIISVLLCFLPDQNAKEHNRLHKDTNDIGREIVESLEQDSEEETMVSCS